jgi:hypothetical protein
MKLPVDVAAEGNTSIQEDENARREYFGTT